MGGWVGWLVMSFLGSLGLPVYGFPFPLALWDHMGSLVGRAGDTGTIRINDLGFRPNLFSILMFGGYAPRTVFAWAAYTRKGYNTQR